MPEVFGTLATHGDLKDLVSCDLLNRVFQKRLEKKQYGVQVLLNQRSISDPGVFYVSKHYRLYCKKGEDSRMKKRRLLQTQELFTGIRQ